MSRELIKYESQKDDTSRLTIKISSTQLVFEEGAIKNIIVEGTVVRDSIKKEQRVYSNKFSIGATTRQNYKDFGGIKLYQETNYQPDDYIVLGDVVKLKRITGIRTNDFSPRDQSFVLYPNESKELYKLPSSQLFSLNIFTDMVGFDSRQPNGLVQIEFSKRINLWTKRTDDWIFGFMGVGWLTHMTPSFEIAKIEENNRILPVKRLRDMTYLSPLEIYQYSFSRISNELNILDLEAPSISLHTNTFMGAALTNVNLVNSEEIDRVKTILVGLKLKLLLRPESKWQYEISSKTVNIIPLENNFEIRSFTKDMEDVHAQGWVHVLEALISWNVSKDTKIFGRGRLNHQWTYARNNFTQIQIGYSAFLRAFQPSIRR